MPVFVWATRLCFQAACFPPVNALTYTNVCHKIGSTSQVTHHNRPAYARSQYSCGTIVYPLLHPYKYRHRDHHNWFVPLVSLPMGPGFYCPHTKRTDAKPDRWIRCSYNIMYRRMMLSQLLLRHTSLFSPLPYFSNLSDQEILACDPVGIKIIIHVNGIRL